MRKQLISLLLLVSILFCSVGCTNRSYRVIGCIRTEDSHHFSMKYIQFDGTVEHRLRVTEDQPLDLKVKIETESGNLSLTISRKDEKPDYRGNQLPSSEFTVTLTSPGTYWITLTGEKHAGSFLCEWN